MSKWSDRATVIRQELEKCRDGNGRITPAAIVKAAQNKKNPLHKIGGFKWNIKEAAMAHWLEHARGLATQYLTVEVITKGQKYDVVGYVRDVRLTQKEQGYISLTGPEMDRKLAFRTIEAEFDRCVQAVKRARNVASVLENVTPGIVSRLEYLLQQIIKEKSTLLEAAE